MHDIWSLGNKPWSSKPRGLGPREQGCRGKARFVKLRGCRPRFGARLEEKISGVFPRMQAPDVAQPHMWPDPWWTVPLVVWLVMVESLWCVRARRGQNNGFWKPGWARHRRGSTAGRPLEQGAQGPRAQGASMLEKGLDAEASGVKSTTESRRWGHYLGCLQRAHFLWVVKPLASSPGPPKAWMK
jgi:hypothetical protein